MFPGDISFASFRASFYSAKERGMNPLLVFFLLLERAEASEELDKSELP